MPVSKGMHPNVDIAGMGKASLHYAGQSSDELIAHQKTHRRDSVLFCLADAIEEKARRGQVVSSEERVVRSVIAMHRAVWERGFGAFFRETGKDVAEILENLAKIGASKVGELVGRAFAARRRAADLEECDEDYFASTETETKLWAYVQKNQKKIQVPAFEGIEASGEEFPSTPMERLWWQLEDAGFRRKETVEACRTRALRIAEKQKLGATETDVEGAVLWFLVANWVEEGRLDDCALIGERALEVAGRELASAVLSWTEQLLEEGEFQEADRWATALMNRWATDPKPWATMDLEIWQDLMGEQGGKLPSARKFFETVKSRISSPRR